MKRRRGQGRCWVPALVLLLPAGLATGSGWKHKDKGGSENVVLLSLQAQLRPVNEAKQAISSSVAARRRRQAQHPRGFGWRWSLDEA